MIVDDIQETRQNIRKLLEFAQDIEVTCEAANGEEAVRKAKILTPDIILMDINMPGTDGIAATEAITNEVPQCAVVIMSVQGEQEYLRQSMVAGAKDFLVKPVERDDLLQRIRKIYLREQNRRVKYAPRNKAVLPGKVVTVFGTKGGLGKTTIAANLAVTLGMDGETKVGIIDTDLQFGDIPLFLNLVPQTSIADLVKEIDCLNSNLIDSYMTTFKGNVKVLAAPFRPEQAVCVTSEQIVKIIKEMQYIFDYIIIDTAPGFSEMVLSILDISDQILVVSSQDLPTLKNVKLCLELLQTFSYPEEKVKVVLNRANSIGGMSIVDAARLLSREFWITVPSDGKTVVTAANQGVPFVISSQETTVAKAIFKLAYYTLCGGKEADQVEKISLPVEVFAEKLLDMAEGRGSDPKNNKRTIRGIPADHFAMAPF